jgi:hypothetical protein
MIEGDPLVDVAARDTRVLDDADSAPLADEPGERVDLRREPVGEGEGHVRGPWRSLHATIPHTHAVATKEAIPRTANVISSAVMGRS